MLHDADLRVKILSALEASDDPEALPLAQLVRDMSSEIEQLTLLLRCPASPISPEDPATVDVGIPNSEADKGTPSQSPAVVLSTALGGTCNGCGRELKAAEKFCPHCGRTAQGEVFCMSCSAPIGPESTFCSRCGSKVA